MKSIRYIKTFISCFTKVKSAINHLCEKSCKIHFSTCKRHNQTSQYTVIVNKQKPNFFIQIIILIFNLPNLRVKENDFRKTKYY